MKTPEDINTYLKTLDSKFLDFAYDKNGKYKQCVKAVCANCGTMCVKSLPRLKEKTKLLCQGCSNKDYLNKKQSSLSLTKKAKKDTSLRLLLMLKCIPVHPRHTTSDEIMEKLVDLGYQISYRTIQRNLLAVEAFFPLLKLRKTGEKFYHWSLRMPIFTKQFQNINFK